MPVPQVVVFPNFTPLSRVQLTTTIGGKMEPYVGATAELGHGFDGQVRFFQVCALNVGGQIFLGQLLKLKHDLVTFGATNGIKTARYPIDAVKVYGIVDKIVIPVAVLTS